jgi:hypothetical protein
MPAWWLGLAQNEEIASVTSRMKPDDVSARKTGW